MSWIDERIKALKEKESPLTSHEEACLQLLEALKQVREALIQCRGALCLDAMVNDDGKPYGTTVVALEHADKAIKQIDALGK